MLAVSPSCFTKNAVKLIFDFCETCEVALLVRGELEPICWFVFALSEADMNLPPKRTDTGRLHAISIISQEDFLYMKDLASEKVWRDLDLFIRECRN
jgi:hypothetical protein